MWHQEEEKHSQSIKISVTPELLHQTRREVGTRVDRNALSEVDDARLLGTCSSSSFTGGHTATVALACSSLSAEL